MAKLNFEILTAERTLYSEEVDIVIAWGVEGQLAILPNHAALLTILQPGELVIRKDGEEFPMAVSGGFLEVRDNKVIVLADTAERAEEIDIARAEEAKRRAEELLTTRPPDMDLAAAEAALRRAMSRLKAAERRRRRPGVPGTGV